MPRTVPSVGDDTCEGLVDFVMGRAGPVHLRQPTESTRSYEQPSASRKPRHSTRRAVPEQQPAPPPDRPNSWADAKRRGPETRSEAGQHRTAAPPPPPSAFAFDWLLVGIREHLRVLGLPCPCSVDVLKRRWRELALRHHPDRGGDVAEFIRVKVAYEGALAYLARCW